MTTAEPKTFAHGSAEVIVLRSLGIIAMIVTASGLLGFLVFVMPVLLVATATLPPRSEAIISIWVVAQALVALPALRVRAELRPGRLISQGYFRRWDVAASDIERLIPVGYGFLVATQGSGAMGMVVRGRERPVLVPPTASWSWRFGSRPSKQAVDLAQKINAWALENGVPSEITADHLSGRR